METEELPSTNGQENPEQLPPESNPNNVPSDDHMHKLNSLAVVKVADTVAGSLFFGVFSYFANAY